MPRNELIRMLPTAALQTFATLLGRPLLLGAHNVNDSASTIAGSVQEKDTDPPLGDATILRHLLQKNSAAEERHSVRLHDVLPIVKQATLPLRAACCSTLDAVHSVIVSVNTKRYSRNYGPEAEAVVQVLQESVGNLKAALEHFSTTDRLMLLKPFEPLIAETHRERTTPLRSLYVTHVFASNLIAVTQAVIRLAEAVLAMARKRTRNRLWFPSSLRHLFKALGSRNDRTDQAIGEEVHPEQAAKHEQEQKSYSTSFCLFVSAECNNSFIGYGH